MPAGSDHRPEREFSARIPSNDRKHASPGRIFRRRSRWQCRTAWSKKDAAPHARRQ